MVGRYVDGKISSSKYIQASNRLDTRHSRFALVGVAKRDYLAYCAYCTELSRSGDIALVTSGHVSPAHP